MKPSTKPMWQSSRLLTLGWLMLVLAIGLPSAAGAVGITVPSGVFTLPVDPGDATTVDLGAPAPFAGTPMWVRLRPNDPPDPLVDYTATVSGAFVSGPSTPTPSNPQIFDITFSITWNGTIDEVPATQAVGQGYSYGRIGEQMLFAIVDSRFGSGMSFPTTSDLPQSGFVRNSFQLDGMAISPEVVLDDDGATTGNFEGFVMDFPDPGCPCNRWLGFYLPATPGVTHTLTMQWALGQTPSGSGNVFFPNALFLPVGVPEPGIVGLLAVAFLGVGVVRARRAQRG